MSSLSAEPAGGSETFGPYVLLDKIASGGIADIYRAKMRGAGGFEKTVAIKRLRREHVESRELASLLVDEAKIGARLTHANIVQVISLERVGDEWGIVLELVEGVDLFLLSRSLERHGRRLGVDECLHIVKDLLSGLDLLHQLTDDDGWPIGLVHCDISPGNVMVNMAGEVKLIDFGISRPGGPEGARGPAGKIRYRAPEQVRGEELDRRSDLYSAGILLWELLAGERIYDALTTEEILDRVSRADVPPIERLRSGLDEGLVRVVRRALHVDPKYRYPHAAAFLRALEDLPVARDASRSRRALAEIVRAVTQAQGRPDRPDRPDRPVVGEGRLADVRFASEPSLEDVLEDQLGA